MPIQDIWPKTMPDVVNLDQSVAESTLDALLIAYDYGDDAYDPLIAVGKIRTQSPAKDATLNLGDTVTLTVSLGAAWALADSQFGYRRLRRYLGDRPT